MCVTRVYCSVFSIILFFSYATDRYERVGLFLVTLYTDPISVLGTIIEIFNEKRSSCSRRIFFMSIILGDAIHNLACLNFVKHYAHTEKNFYQF